VVIRITMAGVISMSLLAAPVLFGFVAGFTTESWTYFLPFAACGALGWIVMFPRPPRVREWYSRQTESAPQIPQPL
jgi:MFS family permease